MANLLAREDRVVADIVASTTPAEIPNVFRLSKWVFAHLEPKRYEVVHCLPAELRSVSSRDPANHKLEDVKRRSADRLSWILNRESGKFLCVLLDSEGQMKHVIGVDAERGAIYDHEDTRTLPLSESGLNACCGGSRVCIGLGEVMEVIRSERIAPKRKDRE
jgi:hypothetical protein